MRVLLLNDAAVECDALTRLLGSLGHEVVARASSSGEGAIFAARLLPDLAIVDGRLPPDGCLPAVSALRTAAPAMLVAIVAALPEIELVRAAVTLGAAGALRRPLLRGEVGHALDEILAHRS
jgi:DNA-binding NarL/FixJ family response regulator